LAATVLSLTLTVIVSGVLWLLLGSLLHLSDDPRQNDLLNFVAYAGATLPFVLMIVLFAIEAI
jgi:hypothetical protein